MWDDDFFNGNSLPQMAMETIIRHKRYTKHFRRAVDPFHVFLAVVASIIIFIMIFVVIAICCRLIRGNRFESSPESIIGQNNVRETRELQPIIDSNNAQQVNECKFAYFVQFIN